jgi:MFS family permease
VPPRDPPASFVPLRLILLLAAGHVSFGGARLALSLQALQLHASALTVGLLMSLLMLVPAFICIHVGRWVDRAGYLRPTWVALAGVALGNAVAALLPSLAGLALASVLVGTSFMFAHVAVNNAIGHVAGVQGRTRAFGLMAVGFSISALVGPLVAGAGIDRIGFRATFVLLGLVPVAVAPLLLHAPRIAREPGPPAAANGGVIELLRLPALRAVLLVSALISSGWDLFTFLVPLHGKHIGLSATAIGVVAGAFGVGSAAVRVALPWIIRRVGEWKLLGSALLLTAVGYFVFPFCTSVGTMLVLAVALGMVLGCGQPVVMSLVHVVAPPSRTGEAVGLRSAITSFGQTVLPLACGAFGAALGLLPLFWLVAGLLGCGGGYAVTRRRQPLGLPASREARA